MPLNAIVRADGIAVRCPTCDRLQANSRGYLVWLPADLASEAKKGEHECQYARPPFGSAPCYTRFFVRYSTLVKIGAA